MSLDHPPIGKAEMLIRKPVAEVFEAFVNPANTGFSGNEDEIVKQAISSAEGFALVLAGLKALLEHDIVLNLISDRFPDRQSEAGNGAFKDKRDHL